MTDVDISQELPIPVERPRPVTAGPLAWLRANLFNSIPNTILTIAALYLLAMIIPSVVRWALVDATWHGQTGRACSAGGACWAFIAEKGRFILFGRYPYAEHWRPLLAVVIFIAMIVASCNRRLWGRRLAVLWLAGLIAVGVLMRGGIFGMTYVDTSLWNGLPLTLILATLGMVFAFPLAILLALGRRSRLPAVRAICVGYIELVRWVPLITLLFMALVMLPLFLPTGMTIDKLLRIQVAFALFAAAYLAETIRGGLQAIPRGQFEAADALGLSYSKKMGLIILPQALKLVVPGIVGSFIGLFKDTSLVLIIGLFDLLGIVQLNNADSKWFSPTTATTGYV